MPRRSLSLRIATLGPLGRSPFAPGTAGTVVAGAPAACLLSLAPGWLSLSLLVLVFFLSVYVSERAAREMGRHDPGEVVIDELAGFLVTMIGLPCTGWTLLLGTAAFRLFDIWKPWPVSAIDAKVKGGLGIVLDDVGAGALAHALVWLILKIWR